MKHIYAKQKQNYQNESMIRKIEMRADKPLLMLFGNKIKTSNPIFLFYFFLDQMIKYPPHTHAQTSKISWEEEEEIN